MIYTVFADISRLDAEKFLQKNQDKIALNKKDIGVPTNTKSCDNSNIQDYLNSNVQAYVKTLSGHLPPLPLSQEVEEHIKKAKNQEVRKERCGAYLLLSVLTKKIFQRLPTVLWTANGKPYYKDENQIFFNISHSDNMVAVSISDTGGVGVDIEGEIDAERGARLEARFFSDITVNASYLPVMYGLCVMEEDGSINIVPHDDQNNPLDKDDSKDNAHILHNSKALSQKDDLTKEFKLLNYDDTQTNKNLVQNHKALTTFSDIVVTKATLADSFTARWTLYEAGLKCDGGGFTSLPCLGMLLFETRADVIKIKRKTKIFYLSTASSKR